MLNGLPVSAEDKVSAANMHGEDAAALAAIRRKYFPNGELDDGGGAIPPTSAGMSWYMHLAILTYLTVCRVPLSGGY